MFDQDQVFHTLTNLKNIVKFVVFLTLFNKQLQRKRKRPETQAGISPKALCQVVSSNRSTLPPISCSSNEPSGFETKQQLGVVQDPVQKRACPFFGTPACVHYRSNTQED